MNFDDVECLIFKHISNKSLSTLLECYPIYTYNVGCQLWMYRVIPNRRFHFYIFKHVSNKSLSLDEMAHTMYYFILVLHRQYMQETCCVGNNVYITSSLSSLILTTLPWNLYETCIRAGLRLLTAFCMLHINSSRLQSWLISKLEKINVC